MRTRCCADFKNSAKLHACRQASEEASRAATVNSSTTYNVRNCALNVGLCSNQRQQLDIVQ